jgi:hypothetical protein
MGGLHVGNPLTLMTLMNISSFHVKAAVWETDGTKSGGKINNRIDTDSPGH